VVKIKRLFATLFATTAVSHVAMVQEFRVMVAADELINQSFGLVVVVAGKYFLVVVARPSPSKSSR